jgi:sugar (pentulose or hexulose) kinase
MSFIGIDLGTTFLKAAVLNLRTRCLEQVRRTPFPNRCANPNPLLWEFDAFAIVNAVSSLLEEIAPYAPDCEGVVMSSQMHGLVLTDDAGAPQSPCVNWRDRRALTPDPKRQGSCYFDEIMRRVDARQRRQLGNELQPERPVCTLFWLAEQGKLRPGLTPVSMPDFVIARLCQAAPGVEATHAGGYGALNLETMDWHRDVIEELGLGNLKWPRIRSFGERAGHLQVGTRRVPCYAPLGDYQCSMAGVLLGADEISLNISTGAQVSRRTRRLSLGEYQSRPFFDGEFLNTFSYPPGGRALDVLVDLLLELPAAQHVKVADPWGYLAQAAEQAAATDLKVNLDLFCGTAESRGTISNIRDDNFSAGHLFRAALNDLAERYHDCAQRLYPDGGWKNVVFSGGVASHLKVLRDIVQKRFGTGYRLPPLPEDALFGLLILALVLSGQAPSVNQATLEMAAHVASPGR